MRRLLNRFILGFPVLVLKQYPYAWIVVVVFWPGAPMLVAICLAVMALAMAFLRWQNAAWIAAVRHKFAGENGKFYIDEPPIYWRNTFKNVAILAALSVVMSYMLHGQFGLTFWQYLVMSIGFTIFYSEGRFFGAKATYIITASGIGIRLVPGHIDYRLFLPFKEISSIERGAYSKQLDTDIFARTRDSKDGLLLVPKDPKGFTKRIDKLFIVPKDVDAFLEQLPYGYGK